MVSKEQKKAAVYRKLQLLRSITNPHAQRKTSTMIDVLKYIKDLKQKMERVNQEIAEAQNSTAQNSFPMVHVEDQEKGFLVSVVSERSCNGLLVFILEAFESMGLDVLQARVSCSTDFHLEAIGGYVLNEGQADQQIDAQGVKQSVLQAVHKWRESSEQE
ncbi:transcription factor bHLH61-like isoform X2 [Camellia sinensis]|uniref:Plant bHLH transcription factor ACT-like domain-containing protein n=1 Tax=Camellia sinensis var. sinensis TaxID=542762 RepID=A0A4S4D375_CAMSN|nr:transcription factor bHLH61-like isoform X2 [Camellia sinensis]THF96750.1 hypothetical protein TEA_029818 [Camellia sinensis var. sinensis]